MSFTGLDPNALRRSGTYDAVPIPRTRQESFVSAFELLQAINCDKVSMIASFKKKLIQFIMVPGKLAFGKPVP